MSAKDDKQFLNKLHHRLDQIEASIDELTNWAREEKDPQRVRLIAGKLTLLEQHLVKCREELGVTVASLVHADDLKDMPEAGGDHA